MEDMPPAAADASSGGSIPPGFGVPLAVATGVCYACAANLASYFATEAERTGRHHSRRHQYCVDALSLFGYVVGGGIITVAYASGDAVPVVNAIMVATNLLVNMLLQMGLGITFYNKDMRTGTLIFVCAVLQLSQMGPAPRGHMDLQAQFSRPLALGWLCAVAAVCALSAVGMWLTASLASENLAKIVSWSLVISCLGAMTDNGASLFGVLTGWVLFCALAAYFAMAFVLLLLSSRAPAMCEASLYVPMQLCMQMCLNMATGFFVWEDQQRLTHLDVYLATFAICLMSVYIASTNVDVMASGRVRLTAMRGSIDRSHFGRSVLELLASWQQLEAEPSEEGAQSAALALHNMLERGLSRGAFTQRGIADIVVALSGEASGHKASAAVVHWMEHSHFFRSYEAWHPEFREALHGVLSAEEREKIVRLNFLSSGDEESTSEDASEADRLKHID